MSSSDIPPLERALSGHGGIEMDWFARLEHDLRSTMGVISGFAALIKEAAEEDPGGQRALLLKGARAIQESAAKALHLLDAASEDQRRQRSGEPVQEKR